MPALLWFVTAIASLIVIDASAVLVDVTNVVVRASPVGMGSGKVGVISALNRWQYCMLDVGAVTEGDSSIVVDGSAIMVQ